MAQAAFMKNEEKLMLKWINSGKIARYVQKLACSDIFNLFFSNQCKACIIKALWLEKFQNNLRSK